MRCAIGSIPPFSNTIVFSCDYCNRSFCGKNATVYGKGVYFAKDIAYSTQTIYSRPDPDGFQYILAAKVLVGKTCLGRANQPAPDFIKDSARRYDATVDSLQRPSIVVVYNDAQALPEYLLKFRV